MGVARSWAISTVRKALTQIRGALLNLPLYTKERTGYDMAQHAEWKAASAGVGILTKSAPTDPPLPITYEQYQKARKIGAKTPTVVLFVDMMWALAARAGDVAGLRKEDIYVGSTQASTGGQQQLAELTVTIRRGKGARFRGPYPIATMATEETADTLRKALAELKPGERLFQDAKGMKKAAKELLQSIHPRIMLPSIRKGAARQLAESGATLEQLGQILGHTRKTTTQIYLGFGAQISGDLARTRTKTASLHHHPSPPNGHRQ